MRERIEFCVDEDRIARNDENAERLARAQRFEATDRVPVLLNTNQWTAFAARKVTFAQYISSPRSNLREQLLNMKWRLENVLDDMQIPTQAVYLEPDLGCIRGMEFDIQVTFPENQPPKSCHLLHDAEEIDTLEVPEPTGGSTASVWNSIME